MQGMMTGSRMAGVRVPGYLSITQDLKFSDVPAGCFASLEAIPTAGHLELSYFFVVVCKFGLAVGLPWAKPFVCVHVSFSVTVRCGFISGLSGD